MDQARAVAATFTALSQPPANEPPTAQPRTGVTAPQGESKDLVLLASDEDGDPLSYSIVQQPRQGELTSTDDGNNTVVYTADENASGEDSFTFKVNDGQADSDVATMNLIITNRLVVTTAPNGRVTADAQPAGNCIRAVENADLCGDYAVGEEGQATGPAR